MKTHISALLVTLTLVAAMPQTSRAGDLPDRCVPGQVEDFHSKFNTERTGYYPAPSRMEGGSRDRLGHPLKNLQDYLKGKSAYVSVAMDSKAFPYGTRVRIPALEKEFNQCIIFRVVDTGGRFRNRGTRKMDICNDNREHAYQSSSNGEAEVFVLKP